LGIVMQHTRTLKKVCLLFSRDIHSGIYVGVNLIATVKTLELVAIPLDRVCVATLPAR